MKTLPSSTATVLVVLRVFRLTAAVRYMDMNNTRPITPYTNSTTAANPQLRNWQGTI